MRSKIFLVLLTLALCGCASGGPPVVGSAEWHKARIAEIETAYQNKEINTAKYLQLKNQTDAMRAAYLRNWDAYSGFGYYGRRYHKSKVGIGVDVGF